MPVADLDTTNLLLGIMAGVSVLEALALIVLGVMAYRAYRELLQTIHRVEHEQIRPVRQRLELVIAKVEDLVGDVREVTTTVTRRTEQAASFMARPVTRVVGVARAAKVVFDTLFNHRHAPEPWGESAAEAARRAAGRSEHYAG